MIGFVLRLVGGNKLLAYGGLALAVMALIGGIFWAGATYNDRARDAELLQNRIDAKEKRDETEDEVDARDDADLVDGILRSD